MVYCHREMCAHDKRCNTVETFPVFSLDRWHSRRASGQEILDEGFRSAVRQRDAIEAYTGLS